METLGVRPPNALVRVSEYVDEIIEYIKKIIENGFAYEEDGDVFFDIQTFKSKGFDYGKTSPHDDNDVKALLDEGEGALSAHKMKKRNPQDFALWKKSKVLSS
jgi:cysteinyl-tRNA synthetase